MDAIHNYDDDGEREEANDVMARENGNAFRTIEITIALIAVLGVMLRLPFAVRIFGQLLHRLLLLLLTPLVIFTLCGIAGAAVMLKSFRLSTRNISERNAGTNFYANIVNLAPLDETVAFNHQIQIEVPLEFKAGEEQQQVTPDSSDPEDGDVVYEDKEIISCDREAVTTASATPACDISGDVESDSDSEAVAGTERNGITKPDVVLHEISSPRDLLNDADFKKAIDTFIQNQRELLKLQNRTSVAVH